MALILWKEELTSLSTLVGTVATLLAVITPSEGVEIGGNSGGHPLLKTEPGMENILVMDYWMVLPIIVMVTSKLPRMFGLLYEFQAWRGCMWLQCF